MREGFFKQHFCLWIRPMQIFVQSLCPSALAMVEGGEGGGSSKNNINSEITSLSLNIFMKTKVF